MKEFILIMALHSYLYNKIQWKCEFFLLPQLSVQNFLSVCSKLYLKGRCQRNLPLLLNTYRIYPLKSSFILILNDVYVIFVII